MRIHSLLQRSLYIFIKSICRQGNDGDSLRIPSPLTDEEFVEFQKKEKRKVTIIGDIIDFIANFFR